MSFTVSQVLGMPMVHKNLVLGDLFFNGQAGANPR